MAEFRVDGNEIAIYTKNEEKVFSVTFSDNYENDDRPVKIWTIANKLVFDSSMFEELVVLLNAKLIEMKQ